MRRSARIALNSSLSTQRLPPGVKAEVSSGARLTTADYLMHLCVHFAYHLGQLDSHRRLVTGNPAGVGALRPIELGSARPVG